MVSEEIGRERSERERKLSCKAWLGYWHGRWEVAPERKRRTIPSSQSSFPKISKGM